MGIFDKARAKLEELYGRAEELYGQSHGDAAAEVRGEAHILDGEAEEGRDRDAAAEEDALGRGPAAERAARTEEVPPTDGR
jgi:uncharacterized protein YjbJ (UPF0337 family)